MSGGTSVLSAADPRRSAWVSANAGAGKTHTLANRVTRLLLDGAKPERILCLTYTKAAAAEMQGRLFDRLGAWAMFDDVELSRSIAEIGAPPCDAEGLRRARRLFALALETPGGLKIQTIHAFCQYVLSRFPLEAGIAPSFRVLDEQTSRDLIGEARAQVLERAGSGDARLATAAAHLVTETSEYRLKQILDAALGNERGKLERFFESLPLNEAALRLAAARAHGVDEGDSVKRIAGQFCDEARHEAAKLTEIVTWLARGGRSDFALAEQLRKFTERGFSLDAFLALRSAFCKTDGKPREKLATAALVAADPAAFEALTRFAFRYLDAEHRCRAARAASLAEAALTIANAVCEIYANEKRARGVLDYDDLVAETLRLLERREAAAWVLYKLDGGLDHILVDEAQDTSPAQWAIVRKLTEEFFAGEGRRATARTMFAVGDEKQSIFSFQGADPLEFEINKRHFAARTGEAFVDVPLETSRRSAPEILTFVDEVFADPAAREGLSTSTEPIVHRAFREDVKGRVELWPALRPIKGPEPDPWRPVDVESEASPVVKLAERIARQIKSWLDAKARLPGHEAPIRPGDIMILMPRREPFASEIIRHLTQAGVPVAGADRIKLKDQIAVMDLIALGRFALLPDDDLNLAAVLRSPLIDLSEEELFALACGRSGSLWRTLRERQHESLSFAFAHRTLAEALARADFAPPYEFYARPLASGGMRARLVARLGGEAGDAIDEFLSLALAYEPLSTPSLQGFLQWMERGDAQIRRDMERGRDEVRVMTVHGAKGLEADIVFLPDTTSLPDPPGRRGELLFARNGIVFPLRKEDASDSVQAAKDAAETEALKEHRRLLYVALTRAKDRLYVCGFESLKGVRKGSWYELAERAAKKIGTEIERGGERIYVVGDEPDEPASGTESAPRERVPVPVWVRTAPKPEPERPRLIRPSDEIVAGEPAMLSPAGPRAAQRFRRGLLVHALLARLPEIEPARRRGAALAYLQARELVQADAEALAGEVLAVLAHPDFAAAFAPGSRAETGIIADLPDLGEATRISGRLDRLAIAADEVLAVDFKTNRPPPTRAEDTPALYLRQMALYRAALARIFPARRIACALVWTEGPRLMRLPDGLMDAEMAALRARLDSAPSGS